MQYEVCVLHVDTWNETDGGTHVLYIMNMNGRQACGGIAPSPRRSETYPLTNFGSDAQLASGDHSEVRSATPVCACRCICVYICIERDIDL